MVKAWYNAMPQTKMHRFEFLSETFDQTLKRFIKHCCNLDTLQECLSWIKLWWIQKRCRYATVPARNFLEVISQFLFSQCLCICLCLCHTAHRTECLSWMSWAAGSEEMQRCKNQIPLSENVPLQRPAQGLWKGWKKKSKTKIVWPWHLPTSL